jgi:hypothetical protein
MKLLISGSRYNLDGSLVTYAQFNQVIDESNLIWLADEFILGGARGVDSAAEEFAKRANIPTTIMKADWSLGRHAGFQRNSDMLDVADKVLAVWNGHSKGTLDTLDKARRRGMEVEIVYI